MRSDGRSVLGRKTGLWCNETLGSPLGKTIPHLVEGSKESKERKKNWNRREYILNMRN